MSAQALAWLLALTLWLPLEAPAADAASFGELGPHVRRFRPDMPSADIQRIADEVAARQADNEFGDERYALLFEPGEYGAQNTPLDIKVGYYTQVAGLGVLPTDVRIHGVIQVRNRCFPGGGCVALDNFWRSLSNLSIEVPAGRGDCEAQIWAVSQAVPVRRIKVSGGDFKLTDKCTAPAFASGGFIADSAFDGDVQNGGQQQFLVRNSRLAHWVGGNWNQVFAGVEGAVPSCSAGDAACPYFSLPKSPISREAPYLFRDGKGRLRVFRPAVRRHSAGVSWGRGVGPGESIPVSDFFVAGPEHDAAAINAALKRGKYLLLTPGVYHLTEPVRVTGRGTVILGLGFPTLVPDRGGQAMVIGAPGVLLSGVLFEAGAAASAELLRVGEAHEAGDAGDPTSLTDVFFRVGGARVGRASVSLVVNQGHVLLDHIWAWRADHGQTGWDLNLADTGLIVRGDQVTAYGLFIEHYQKSEVIWEGNAGTVIFLQNEMPYDPPDQASWRSSARHDGYPAFKVGDRVTRFRGMAFGSYNYFNRGAPVFAEQAFEMPATLPAGSLKDAFTIFLNAAAAGGVRHVVNDRGGSATAKNPDLAVRVDSYP